MPRYTKSDSNSVSVYSTETGRHCAGCGKPSASCGCKKGAAAGARPATDGVVRVRRETGGRGGKVVTSVTGAPGDDAAVKALAKKLKNRLGVGGSVKDWVIVIQGDHVVTVMELLQAEGLKVKKSGG